MDSDLALLHQKIDRLTEQIERQQRRQQELEDLQQDVIPIVNHMIKLSIDELAEIGSDFTLEDLFFLVKRLLRDTHLLLNMLDQLESTAALGQEISPLVKPVFNQSVEALNTLEQRGLFAFLRGLWYVADRVLTEFDEQDVRALGDNVVTILNTVRHMTQPEVLALANTTLEQLETPVEGKVSTWRLLRELNDPQVRLGLVRMLGVVKTFANTPETSAS